MDWFNECLSTVFYQMHYRHVTMGGGAFEPRPCHSCQLTVAKLVDPRKNMYATCMSFCSRNGIYMCVCACVRMCLCLCV